MAHSSKLPLHVFETARERRTALAEEGWLDSGAWDIVSLLTCADWIVKLSESVENVVGAYHAPLCVATNFTINGQDRPVPMSTEERTVVAAASKAAKLCRPAGFTAKAGPPIAVAQLFYARLKDADLAVDRVRRSAPSVIEALRKGDRMAARGGGAYAVDARLLPAQRGTHLVVEVRMDVRDAMGANAATEAGHRAGALLMDALGAEPTAVICGNDVPERRVIVRAVWRAETLGADLAKGTAERTDPQILKALGRAGIERVLDLQDWAAADPSRAVTHVKGIMNGVTAVGLVTGQDTRALEAAVWAEACRDGACRPLTSYRMMPSGDLYGKLVIPLVVGTVGGGTGHPMARFARQIGGIESARELMETMAAVGLAQNFAALWSLSNEGILASHEKLGRRTRPK